MFYKALKSWLNNNVFLTLVFKFDIKLLYKFLLVPIILDFNVYVRRNNLFFSFILNTFGFDWKTIKYYTKTISTIQKKSIRSHLFSSIQFMFSKWYTVNNLRTLLKSKVKYCTPKCSSFFFFFWIKNCLLLYALILLLGLLRTVALSNH